MMGNSKNSSMGYFGGTRDKYIVVNGKEITFKERG